MGWKGTMRAVSAASRRMEKDAQRRHKQDVKDQMTEDTADAVERWEAYIDDLLTIHTNLTERVNWENLLVKAKPKEPLLEQQHLNKAKTALAAFKPRIFDFLKGGSAKRRAPLDDAISKAPQLDEADYKLVQKKHINILAEWETDRCLAERLIAGEGLAIQEVIAEMQTISEEKHIGSSVQYSIGDNYIHARPQVHTEEIIPNFRRKQLASGRLSETKMPAGQFNELYQDYVASVALKVAGDLFQIIPINEIFITCESNMLNSATGHKEATPILSVQFVRDTMEQLRLEDIDPSDAMRNFNHSMKFSKTKGFAPISPLQDYR